MAQTPPSQTPAAFGSFGALLRYLRRCARLTQREVAIAVGYSESQISRFEQGHRPPDEAALQALFLPALGVAPDSAWAQRFLDLAALARGAAGADPAGAPPPGGSHEGLLATKLFCPRPPDDLVLRPRLLDRCDHTLRVPLTLVAAPAGAGKTTLLSVWLQQIAATRDAGRAPRVAWLALDAHDNDPVTFLRYLVAAVQVFAPGAGDGTLELLRTPLPPHPVLLGPLINDLALLDAPCVLVLDDYHLLTAPEIHAAVAFVLDHNPPHLHLLIASRETPPLPLARVRARRQLLEIGASDLRFTGEEAARLLEGVSGSPLTAEQLAAVDASVEGWAAGLQLVGLAIKGRPDPAPLIAGLAEGNRYLVDYLALEVLSGLPAHLRSFLLQTSILDRLSGPLCDAVLGLATPDQAAATRGAYSGLLLQELERRHLFLVHLDEERGWFRYQHLFAAFLRTQLRENTTEREYLTLHRRAAAWFVAQGLTSEAIEHALAGQDLELAARLIGQVGLQLATQGRLPTVLGWLGALPEPVLRADANLSFLNAVLLLNSHQPAAAAAWLEVAERGLATAPEPAQRRALYGQLLVLRSGLARAAGDIAGCVADAESALQHLSGAPAIIHSAALFNAACAFLDTGDVAEASAAQLSRAIDASAAAGNTAAHLIGLVALGILQTLQGRRHRAGATYRDVLARLDTLGAAARGRSGALLAYGEWLREHNLLAEAEQQLDQALGAAHESTIDAHLLLAGTDSLVRLRLAAGRVAEAGAALERSEAALRDRPLAPHLRAHTAATRALIALAAGEHSAAASWAARLGPIGAPTFAREWEYLALARVWLAQFHISRDPAQSERALALLDPLLADADACRRLDSAIRIRVLQALLLQAAGAAGRALAALSVALPAAAPEGYTRIFLDEGAPMAELLQAALARGIAPEYSARLLGMFPPTSPEPGAVG